MNERDALRHDSMHQLVAETECEKNRLAELSEVLEQHSSSLEEQQKRITEK